MKQAIQKIKCDNCGKEEINELKEDVSFPDNFPFSKGWFYISEVRFTVPNPKSKSLDEQPLGTVELINNDFCSKRCFDAKIDNEIKSLVEQGESKEDITSRDNQVLNENIEVYEDSWDDEVAFEDRDNFSGSYQNQVQEPEPIKAIKKELPPIKNVPNPEEFSIDKLIPVKEKKKKSWFKRK